MATDMYSAAAASAMYAFGLADVAQRSTLSRSDSTQYVRRTVATEFHAHLARLPFSLGITLETAQPSDVTVFISQVWVPGHGRTILSDGTVHPSGTAFRSVFPALSYLFHIHGRVGEWSLAHPYNDPCNSQHVWDYRQGVERFLTINAPPPVAAHPFTEKKLAALLTCVDAQYMKLELQHPGTSGGAFFCVRKILLCRDALLMVYLFFSYQRGGEGASIRLSDVSLPGGAAPLGGLDARLGSVTSVIVPIDEADEAPSVRVHPPRLKTCRGRPRVYIDVKRNPDVHLCFLHRLGNYQAMRHALGYTMQCNDVVFPAMDPRQRGSLTAAALTSSGLGSRLKDLLVQFGLYEGETVHSWRRGGLQNAAKEGVDPKDSMQTATMRSLETYYHYIDTSAPTRKLQLADEFSSPCPPPGQA
jgi:hypothetical protein